MLAESSLPAQEREERWRSLEAREQVLDLMLARVPAGRLILSVETEEFENSPHNVLLEDGDAILIPPYPGSVLVVGSVYMPEALVHVPGLTLADYLRQVGGSTPDADVHRIYVIKANGQVETHGTGFSEIRQGDVIVVPPKDLATLPGWEVRR